MLIGCAESKCVGSGRVGLCRAESVEVSGRDVSEAGWVTSLFRRSSGHGSHWDSNIGQFSCDPGGLKLQNFAISNCHGPRWESHIGDFASQRHADSKCIGAGRVGLCRVESVEGLGHTSQYKSRSFSM